MDDDGTARRPVVGPLTVLAQRSAKRRMARSMQKVRDPELV
jgi:hypothetical protein